MEMDVYMVRYLIRYPAAIGYFLRPGDGLSKAVLGGPLDGSQNKRFQGSIVGEESCRH